MIPRENKIWKVHSRNKELIPLIFIVTIFLSPAQAQIKGINEGNRVRVFAPSISEKKIIGTVDDISTSAILLSTQESRFIIPKTSIKQISVSRGKKGNAGKGAWIGALSGGLILGIVASSENSGSDACDNSSFDCLIYPEFSDSEVFAIWGALGAFGGAVLGALIGTAIQSDDWKQVDIAMRGPIYLPNTDLAYSPTFSVKFPLGR